MFSNISKAFHHLKTILKHKYWVFHYARMAGIPFRGLVHDLSKFHQLSSSNPLHGTMENEVLSRVKEK